MSLVECSGLWGEANLMYGEPLLHIYENVTYVPYSRDTAWGLFDRDNQIILEALDRRGGSRTPHLRATDWSSEFETDDFAEEDVYLYCGWLNPHFGHFIINSLPKFWPFLRGNDHLKVLCSSSLDGCPFFIRQSLMKLGLSSQNIFSFDRPLRIRRVIVPEVSLLEQYWVYTIFRDLCSHIGSGFWRHENLDVVDKPAYLSKTRLASGVGKFEDESVIERIVSQAGVDIFYPELLDFSEIVDLFARRRLIIGPTGSAFHASVFSPPGRRMICVNPAPAVNANYVLLDTVAGNKASYFYQEGMTYKTSSEFLTIVNTVDARQIGHDLLELARRHTSW